MQSKIVLPLVGVASVLALAAVFVFRPLPTRITRENAAQVYPGMTLAEVIEILGEPRSEVSWPTPSQPASVPFSWKYTFPSRDFRRWVGESVDVTIGCNDPRLNPESQVVLIDVVNHEFGSAWEFVQWRVRRVLGLAPDVPTPVESETGMSIF